MGKGDYTINNFYQGGYSSFKPGYGDVFTGYHVAAGSLGVTTDPRTANLIKDVSGKLAAGTKQIELALVSPEIFDSIPKDHLKEVNRLSKLTGVDVSVHGPVVDVVGISREGYSDLNRQAAERKLIDFVERAHEVNPEGGSPIVFHSAEGIQSSEWMPKKEGGRELKRMIAIDKESGRMVPIETAERYYPGEDLSKAKVSPPEHELEVHNASQWSNAVDQVFFNKERADEILKQNEIQIKHLQEDLEKIGKDRIRREDLTPTQRDAYDHYLTAKNYLDDVHKTVNNLFSRAYKYGDTAQKENLQEISDNFKKDIEKNQGVSGYSEAMHVLLSQLGDQRMAPRMAVPIEEFAIEKSAQTFGNTAFEAYKKFGEKSPIIAIENPPAGFALSSAEELKSLVEASREQFVQKATEAGIDRGKAEDTAKKIIGATWDVGHINMLRKFGYTEKDLIRETEKIAPFVKHIHLSDNFGFEHTELPMGMGNVPLKEMLEKLPEKDVKKIIETGQWWQHFQTSPVRESFMGLGSPMYLSGGGPNWNQTLGFQQNYFSGYGQLLPPINFQTYGSGFSSRTIPMELGGNVAGSGGRMSGTPME